MSITAEEKAKVISDFATKKGDTGSPEVQIAILTSRINTLVEVSHIDSTSNAASMVEVTTYLATEPNPGQQSVTARSLSTVFGIAIH